MPTKIYKAFTPNESSTLKTRVIQQRAHKIANPAAIHIRANVRHTEYLNRTVSNDHAGLGLAR